MEIDSDVESDVDSGEGTHVGGSAGFVRVDVSGGLQLALDHRTSLMMVDLFQLAHRDQALRNAEVWLTRCTTWTMRASEGATAAGGPDSRREETIASSLRSMLFTPPALFHGVNDSPQVTIESALKLVDNTQLDDAAVDAGASNVFASSACESGMYIPVSTAINPQRIARFMWKECRKRHILAQSLRFAVRAMNINDSHWVLVVISFSDMRVWVGQGLCGDGFYPKPDDTHRAANDILHAWNRICDLPEGCDRKSLAQSVARPPHVSTLPWSKISAFPSQVDNFNCGVAVIAGAADILAMAQLNPHLSIEECFKFSWTATSAKTFLNTARYELLYELSAHTSSALLQRALITHGQPPSRAKRKDGGAN
jgi:hypothetical protein